MENNPFTCITCRMLFDDAEKQRTHYRTAWHCFNLKRKVANLPPIEEKLFDKKVREFQQKQANENTGNNNDDNNNNWKGRNNNNSKKQHKYRKGKNRAKVNLSNVSDISVNDTRDLPQEKKEEIKTTEEEEPENEKTEEELIEERLKTARAIPLTESLFDGFVSSSVQANLDYMRSHFGFFLPFVEALHDLEGLLLYLGEKVGIGYCCIYCSKEFYSASAARNHMADKGHCKILFYDNEEEYGEFYNLMKLGFVATDNTVTGDGEETEESKELVLVRQEDFIQSEIGELLLPNGMTIGHRSLQQYYKQKTKPNYRTSSDLVVHLRSEYKQLGLKHQNTKHYFDHVKEKRNISKQKKIYVDVGIKANKLQKHFRPQVDF